MNNELMHAVGDDPAWSESYYFNFVDPESKIGMFTRMGFRPGNGWADALHVIYLEGRRLAFTYARREIEQDLSHYDGDLTAGDLRLSCIEPHQHWQIDYDGPAQDIADGRILLARRKSRPDGWYSPARLSMNLNFHCLTEPHYAAEGARGHFEQSGRVQGSIALDGDTRHVNGYGVRDKSWGPRDWGSGNQQRDNTRPDKARGPKPFVNWFSMNFGDHAALGGSCFRHSDTVMRGEGWLQRDGRSEVLEEVIIDSSYATDSLEHESVHLRARTASGETLEIHGTILSLCPTKIAMPGGATFVNEGLAEFRWEDRIGYGIAEHWHAVTL